MEEMYKAICNAEKLTALFIHKVFKGSISAKALPKLILYKIVLSRYKVITKKLIIQAEKIKNQELLREPFESLDRNLCKAYEYPLEAEEILRQKIRNL